MWGLWGGECWGVVLCCKSSLSTFKMRREGGKGKWMRAN
jgi:hypothetical protein